MGLLPPRDETKKLKANETKKLKAIETIWRDFYAGQRLEIWQKLITLITTSEEPFVRAKNQDHLYTGIQAS